MKTLVALVLVVVAAGSLVACPPRVVQQTYTQYPVYLRQDAVYVAPVIYTAVFSPLNDVASAAILDELAAMRAELKAELAAMRSKEVLPEPMAAKQSVGRRVVCSQCHAASKADEKGDGLILFTDDGTPAKLRGRELQALARVLSGGKPQMPPPGKGKPLTPQQVAEMAQAFGLEASDKAALPPAAKK